MTRPHPVFRYRAALDRLYDENNRRENVRPDPIELLYGYRRVADREIVGLIAASLAYGRVASILQSAARILEKLGSSPAEYLERSSREEIARACRGFRHRWTTAEDLSDLLRGIKGVRARRGSLGAAFRGVIEPADATVQPALSRWVSELTDMAGVKRLRLLPLPGSASACKRLHLYLRWMVRHDAVDPGGWDGISPAMLIVPLDVHMFRIGRALKLTTRRQPNLAAALDITSAFRLIAPDDPVRYDFALTRLPIRDRLKTAEIFQRLEKRT